jgi:hypothetical protein
MKAQNMNHWEDGTDEVNKEFEEHVQELLEKEPAKAKVLAKICGYGERAD